MNNLFNKFVILLNFMTPSAELFELIKSMTQSEKTYFKKYSRLHTVGSENSYLLLFDAICRQEAYDEKKVIKQLAGHDFVKHFAVVKNYLYARVLDALESYHRDANVTTQVRRAITRAEILHRKGLYGQSIKLAEKTKRTAIDLNLNHATLEIYTALDLILHTEKKDAENLKQLYPKVLESLTAIRENMLTHNLASRMVDCYGKYNQTRDGAYLKEARELTRSSFYKEASRSKTFMGKLRFNEINFTYAYMKNDLKNSHRYEEKIVSLFDSNPNYLKNNVKKYISACNNLFVISAELGDIALTQSHLEKLGRISSVAKTHSQKAMYYHHYILNSLHYLCWSGNIPELSKSLPSGIITIAEYENEFSAGEKIDVLMHIAIAYYYLGDLKKGISYLNRLRNQFDLSENPEVQSFFHLFYLIVHYDAGNRELVVSSIQAFYRFLNKKQEVSKLEKEVIVFLRRQANLDSEEKIKAEFIRFRKVLASTRSTYLDKYIFKYIDLASWLESKIEKRPFVEIVERTSQKYSN